MKKIKIILLCGIFLLFTLARIYSQELTASEIFDKVTGSVVVIKSFDSDNNIICQGSGVVIDDGLIVTDFRLHCGGGKIGVFQNNKLIDYPNIEAADFDNGIMILKLNTQILKKIETGNSSNVITGEKIYTIGSPLGLENTITDGIISGIRNIDNKSLVQITAPVSPGSSGGAVVNSNGELIAISRYQNNSGQNLNFSVPVNTALNFIKEYYLNPDDTEAKLMLLKGGFAFISDDYTGALTLYNEYIKRMPGSAIGYISRGLLYGEMAEYKKALDDFDKAIELEPSNDKSYITRGILNSFLGSSYRALEDFDMAVKLNGSNSLGYKGRGLEYFIIKDYKKALDDFSKSIEINNIDEVSYYYRGIVYFNINDFTNSINDFNKAVNLAPDFTEAYFSRALSYYKLNNLDKAIEDYKKCLEIYPDDEFAYNNLGWTYIDKADYTEAIGCFRKSYELDEHHWNAYLGAALSYYALGDINNTKKYYKLSCKEEPVMLKGMKGILIMEKKGFIFSAKQKKLLKEMFDEIL